MWFIQEVWCVVPPGGVVCGSSRRCGVWFIQEVWCVVPPGGVVCGSSVSDL